MSVDVELSKHYDTKMMWYSGVNLPLLHQIEKFLSTKSQPCTILDIGCGPGSLGKALREKGHTVWGIDMAESAVVKAKKNLNQAFRVDLATEGPPFKDAQFDLIIYADILEHLPHPERLIEQYLTFLAPGGGIAVSVPNIANYTIRLKLLFGKFDYKSHGILDDTHVRFFTIRNLRQLLDRVGLEIATWDVSSNGILARWPRLHGLEQKVSSVAKTLLGYQFVLVATRKK